MSKFNNKRMLDFKEVADYVGLSVQTVKNKFYQGVFPVPAKKIFSKVLFDIQDVDNYLNKLNKIDC